MEALKPALLQSLIGKKQDEDRPATSAAIEVITGLLGTDAAFIPQGAES